MDRRIAFAVWTAVAALGTIGVWWFSSYLDSLTALAHLDREAALMQFRWRVLPVFIVLVIVAVVAGGGVVRAGLRIVRLGGVPVPDSSGVAPPPPAPPPGPPPPRGFFPPPPPLSRLSP